MRGFALFCTLTAVGAVLAAFAIGTHRFFRPKRSDFTSRDSYYPSTSFNSGATWNQTRQVYSPSPPPSHDRGSYRSPATYAHSQTAIQNHAPPARAPSQTPLSPTRTQPSAHTPWTQQVYPPLPSPTYTQNFYRPPATQSHNQSAPRTPAHPEYDGGVYHSSVASPHARELSPARIQPSSHAPRTQTQQVYPPPPSPTYSRSSYRSPAIHTHNQSASKTPAPPEYDGDVYHSSVASPHTRAQSQTQLSSIPTQASSHVPSREPTGSEPRLPTEPAVVSSDPHSDEPASVEDLEFAKKLREQAQRRRREMWEARSRVKRAQKKRSHGAAQAHKQEAIAHESAMKELDKRAAKIIFREKNKNREGGKIDLHGLYVAEAIQVAKDQVQTARSRGGKAVHFIVGQGLHSDAGEAKIRPALEDLFTVQGLVHSLDPKNPGVLIVRLDRQ